MSRARWAAVGGGGLLALALAGWAGFLLGGRAHDGSAGMDAMDGMHGAPGAREGGGMAGMDMAGGEAGGGMSMGGMSMDGSVRLTRDDIRNFGITFGTADVESLSRSVRSAGLVEFDETRMAVVAPKFGGWAERLYVDFDGKPVRAGEPLLEVYAPELVTAQEELLLAARLADEVQGSAVQGVAAEADRLLESARRRLAYWDITDAQIDRILETGEVRRTLALHAPVDGIVMEMNVTEGEAFSAGTSLYMIAGLSEVWVQAELFESDASLIREGMPAEVSVNALPGQHFRGRVEYVYPTVRDRTRSLRARIALPNPGGAIKPGMYATVSLTADLGATLTLPASAVLQTGERAVVFVERDDGSLVPQGVELGRTGDDRVEVRSGVEAGARVVTSAHFLLDSESNLAEVMQAMMAQMGMTGMEGMDMDGMDMDGMEDMDGMQGMEGMEMGDDPGGRDTSPDSARPDSVGGG